MSTVASIPSACPYGCVDGWLPLPNNEGRDYYPMRLDEREWYTVETTYSGVRIGTRHALGEGGLCADCHQPTPQREADHFAEQTACPSCNEAAWLSDEEPEGGLSYRAMIELLYSAGARPDDIFPDHWIIDAAGGEPDHWILIYEIGPDTWQLRILF